MRRQLAAIEDALSASEQRDKESQAHIADLGSRLNVALAQKVQELARYRSDFFGRLREILGSRTGVRVVGDRFVFESEVLFDTGSAVLSPLGKPQLDQVATAIQELDREIPPEISWVMRVDGHTDKRPVAGAVQVELGALRRRAPSPSCNISSRRARRRSICWPRASANSSRSRSGRRRRRAAPQPPHRVEAHRTVTATARIIECDAARTDEMLDLWVESWTATMPDIDFTARREWFAAHLDMLRATGARVIGACDPDDALFGFVAIDPSTRVLDQLVVARRAFGKGVAALLIAEARRLCPDRIALSVNAANARARRFYAREGFVVTGESVNARSGLPTLIMEWRAA